jgi:hypothetical protein
MLELARTLNSTLPARLLRTPNQSLAKLNRKPAQMIENKQRRPKSIASFCRVFCVYRGKGEVKTGGFGWRGKMSNTAAAKIVGLTFACGCEAGARGLAASEKTCAQLIFRDVHAFHGGDG